AFSRALDGPSLRTCGVLEQPTRAVSASATRKWWILEDTWTTPSVFSPIARIRPLRAQALGFFTHLPAPFLDALGQIRFLRVFGVRRGHGARLGRRHLCRSLDGWRLRRARSGLQLDLFAFVVGVLEGGLARFQCNQRPAGLIPTQWHSDLERHRFVPQIVRSEERRVGKEARW